LSHELHAVTPSFPERKAGAEANFSGPAPGDAAHDVPIFEILGTSSEDRCERFVPTDHDPPISAGPIVGPHQAISSPVGPAFMESRVTAFAPGFFSAPYSHSGEGPSLCFLTEGPSRSGEDYSWCPILFSGGLKTMTEKALTSLLRCLGGLLDGVDLL